ncbi:hypothetical protein BDZ97DRAFT_753485 [Flammula alnicola]|nr:hypothetical protein BDZ97DRAFT_753485 [Flammula alnicola]
MISVHHFKSSHVQDAIRAARNAVIHSRAQEGPLHWKKTPMKTLRALNVLSTLLCTTHQFDDALREGYEALQTFDSLVGVAPGVIYSYQSCIRNVMTALEGIAASKTNISKSANVIRCLRKLPAENRNDDFRSDMVRATLIYTANLESHGDLREASNVLQELLGKWEETYGPLDKDAKTASEYAKCLRTYSDILSYQGNTEEALQPLVKEIDICKPYSSINLEAAIQMVLLSTSQHPLLSTLSRYPESLETAKVAVDLVRKPALVKEIVLISWSMQVLAGAHIVNGNTHKALGAAKEAAEVCRPLKQSNHIIRIFLSLSLSLLSGILRLADLGNDRESLTCAQEATNEILEVKSQLGLYPIQLRDVAHIIASSTVSVRLFANGDHKKAAELIPEVVAYYQNRSRTHISSSVDLATTLHFAGVVYCAIGRHDGGIAVATELSEMKKRLATTLPSFSHAVEKEFNCQ